MKLLKPALVIATMTVAVSTYATRASQQSTSRQQGEYHLQDQNAQRQTRSLTNENRQAQGNQEQYYRTQQETVSGANYGDENSGDRIYTTQQEITNNGPYGDKDGMANLEPQYRTQQDATHGVAVQQFNNENENIANNRGIASEGEAQQFSNEELENDEFAADTQQDTVTQRYPASAASGAAAGTTASDKKETEKQTASAATTEENKDDKNKKAKKKKDDKKKEEAKDVKADNSGMNKKHNAANKTADDQSNNAGDVEMTRKIRAGLMDKENLSTYAKNIKILVQDNQVVLRGPVRTAEEKSQIAEVASSVAQGHTVKNELEVAAK